MNLVPTETCKHKSLAFDPDSLVKALGDVATNPEGRAIVQMYTLWWATGGKRGMFCFDLNANIASELTGRGMLEWTAANAVVDPDGTTVYIREAEADDAKGGSKEKPTPVLTPTLLCARASVREEFANTHFSAMKAAFTRV